MLPKNIGNNPFVCQKCGQQVPAAPQTARNHCCHCLWSLHVDGTVPGDRAAKCQGLMRPVAVLQKHGVWQVIHVCESCQTEKRNRLAPDDDFATVLKIAENK